MSKFKAVPTSLPGVVLYSITVFADDRGFFMESYNRNELAEVGLSGTFVQDNHSCSKKGVSGDCTTGTPTRRASWSGCSAAGSTTWS